MAVMNIPSAARRSPDVVTRPAPEEIRDLKHLLYELAGISREELKLRIGGDWEEIPPSLYRVLVRATMYLAQGSAVSLVSHSKELTTQSAADLLGISRPHLVQLLEQGVISSWRVGT